jgi:hypothetical protein
VKINEHRHEGAGREIRRRRVLLEGAGLSGLEPGTSLQVWEWMQIDQVFRPCQLAAVELRVRPISSAFNRLCADFFQRWAEFPPLYIASKAEASFNSTLRIYSESRRLIQIAAESRTCTSSLVAAASKKPSGFSKNAQNSPLFF